jgi:hypothetical protein
MRWASIRRHLGGQGAGAGLGAKVRSSLETTLTLAPQRADAQVALGIYHAEILDKVGALLGGLTYGVKKEDSYAAFERALALTPDSAIVKCAMRALLMLDGKRKRPKRAPCIRPPRAAWHSTRWSGSMPIW